MVKKARTRYYLIYYHNDGYHYRVAEDIFHATEELSYLSKQPGVIAFGIYDPIDWRFDWEVSDELQSIHADKVLDLANQLRQRHL